MRDYIASRQEEGAEAATINRELAIVKRMFYLGMECTPRKVKFVPHIPMFTERNTRKGFLESNDYQRLAAECAKIGLWLRTIFELGFTFGWREQEILGRAGAGFPESLVQGLLRRGRRSDVLPNLQH